MEKNMMPPFPKKLGMLPLLLALTLAGLSVPAQAQTFNSGSTGADGAFAPTASETLPVPASGVFNFTTVNIPSNVTITFTKNAANTPVTILASGNMTIAGTLNVSGGYGSTRVSGTGSGSQAFHTVPGAGGPGGFDGGGGGIVTTFSGSANGTAGEGPGGGGGGLGSSDGSAPGDGGGGGFEAAGEAGYHTGNAPSASDGAGGATYGAASLLQLVGGSGGGGGGGYQAVGSSTPILGGSGGGGGGAIVLASSGTITFGSIANGNTAAIEAEGGGGVDYNGAGYGGGGAGGAIRAVATTLAGNVAAYVEGGYSYNGRGSDGYAPRFEAYNFSSFQVTVTSSGSLQPVYAQPSSVALPSPPQLLITSVAGVAAPAAPNGSFQKVPDITLPTTQANPVSVGIQGANIPVGTAVTVEVSPELGAQTFVQSTPLAGTSASSTTATASVTLPTSLTSILYAEATVDLTLPGPGAHLRGSVVRRTVLGPPPLTLNGEAVVRVEVTQAFGGKAGVVYITKSGKRISREQLLGKEAHPAH